jgi:hypothetical protein
MPTMTGNTVNIGGQTNNYFFIDWLGTDYPAQNKTAISWAAYFHFTLADSQLDNGNADLNGSRWDVPGRVYNYSGNFTTRNILLSSGSFDVIHNSQGEATLSVSGGVVPIGTGGSFGSGSWALTTYNVAAGKRWTGSTWTDATVNKRWNGSSWVDLTIKKRWSGSAWQDLS